MGKWSDFVQGYGLGQRMVDDYDARQKKNEIAKISQETASPSFTVDQGQQLDAMANAKDADGKPYYSLQVQPDGKAIVTPNFKDETGDAPKDYNPATIAAGGTQYLGKSYDKPLSDTDKSAAQQIAMAGVMNKYGDTEGAMRMNDNALSLQRRAVTDARDETRFNWENKDRATKDAATERENQFIKKRDEIMANSPMAKAQGEQAKYQADMEAWKQNPQGPQPVAPTQAHITPGQEINHFSQLIDNEAAHGKLSAATLFDFHNKVEAVKKEGYGQALTLAQQGATLDQIAQAFNKQGDVKFDPKNVVSDKMVKGKDGVSSRVIQYRDQNGQVQTIDSLAELNGIGAADKVYARYYQQKGDERSDKSLQIQAGSAAIAANADKRAQKVFDIEMPVHEANAEVAKLKTALAKTEDPVEQQTLSDKIAALNTGRRGVGSQHDPADIMKAKALVAQGIYPNQGEALDAIVNKPDKLYQGYKSEAMKTVMNADRAIEAGQRMMADDGWVKSSGGTWKRAGAGSNAMASDPKAIAIRDDKSLSIDQKKAKLKDLGYQ